MAEVELGLPGLEPDTLLGVDDGGDDKDRYDLQSIVYRRNVVAAARVPSGLNASDRMWSLCPFRTANSSLVVVSHNGSMVWLLC